MKAPLELKKVRQLLIQGLWEHFQQRCPQVAILQQGLAVKSITQLPLDHLAIIDLPSAHTGIPILSRIFTSLGYAPRGNGYLPDKHNDFAWLAEEDSENFSAIEVLPQVVVADFRLEELAPAVKHIIQKYASLASVFDFLSFDSLCNRVLAHDQSAVYPLVELTIQYLSNRNWPLPSLEEYQTVHACNPLLAWVLVFGRRPNHFGIGVNLLHSFSSLSHFNEYLSKDLMLPLNQEGGIIKGDKYIRIEQSSTVGTNERLMLSNGYIETPGNFIEFVWRYANNPACLQPFLWRDFFSGFIGEQANHVIESLIA